MIVDDLDVRRSRRSVWLLKTDPPLVVDTDAVLSLMIAGQRFEPLEYHSLCVTSSITKPSEPSRPGSSAFPRCALREMSASLANWDYPVIATVSGRLSPSITLITVQN
jgi:hypothetical protein